MRAGTLDTQGRFNPAQLDWISKNMPGTIKRVPDLVLFYLAINTARPPFTDVRVREAVNLAFDREAVTDKIRRMGETPAYTIVPPGIANYPGGAKLNFAQMPMSTRIMRARGLMQAAGFGPDKSLHATYLTNNSSDNKVLAPAIQQMLKAIFIDAEIVEAEPAIAYQRLQKHDFDLGHAAWIADYNDAYNFLGSLLASDSRQNYSQYRNPAFDALLAKAQATGDGAARGALLEEAERLALNDFALVPYRYSVTPDLVQPYVKGWIANAKNVNISRWLSIDGRPIR
jgi:oligopeptide transport system substrate-binding protein